MSKVWFITGTSRGFGREFALAVLRRGDQVAATARSLSALDDLAAEYGDRILPLQLDVTDRAADEAAVRQAHERFGRIDVVVNNAGYGHFGAVEEVTEAELRAQLETNFFGAMWVTQAALPILREQGSGHVVQMSSIGGVGAFANLGAYHASKWALEAVSESLAIEVEPLGIRVTLVEPGGFDTDWAGPSARTSAPSATYDFVREAAARRRGGQAPGSPAAAAEALLEIVDSEHPPLRALFGAQAQQIVTGIYERRLKTWQDGADLARRSHGTTD
ncbi:SDR family NAD(P)-dependent oxidoreductase [Promicromonospora sp. NPDC057138]|uniref:SDR family NAD(P)-dependent oxidoreductase n=1 Tax=Promicromonospora sp. NPDC057138 TaxID=3346031 RepID=UPI0036396E26